MSFILWFEWACWILLFLLVGALLISTWNSPDIWGHLERGRVIWNTWKIPPDLRIELQFDPPVFNWIYQVLSYVLYMLGGIPLVSLSYLVLWFLILFLVLFYGDFFKRGLEGIFFGIVSLFIFSSRFTPRADVFSFLFLVIYVYFLFIKPFPNRWTYKTFLKEFYPLLVLQVLWCGLHPFFIWGPVLFLFRFFCDFLSYLFKKEKADIKILFGNGILFFLFALLLILLSMASPYGYKTWVGTFGFATDALHMATNSVPEEIMIKEFISPTTWLLVRNIFSIQVFWFFWIFTLLISFYKIFTQTYSPHVFLSILGLFITVSGVRYLPFLIIFSFPLWSLELRKVKFTFSKNTAFLIITRCSLTAILLVFCISIITNGFFKSQYSNKVFGFGIDPLAYPEKINQYLKSINFKGNIFNDSVAGGFLLFFNDNIRVYGDSLVADLKQDSRDYYKSLNNASRRKLIEKMFYFDAIVLSTSSHEDHFSDLLNDAEWDLNQATLNWALFLRKSYIDKNDIKKNDLSFYDGENLSNPSIGIAAISWSTAFCTARRLDLLLILLKDMQRASSVPAPLIRNALVASLETKDFELLDHIVKIKSKLFALSESEKKSVEILIRKTPAAGLFDK